MITWDNSKIKLTEGIWEKNCVTEILRLKLFPGKRKEHYKGYCFYVKEETGKNCCARIKEELLLASA